MSLQSIIQNLSEKPEHIRKRYSLAISFGVTLIIFSFWISSFSFVKNSENKTIANVIDDIDTPGQTFLASVGSLFVDIKDMVFGPKKVIYSNIEVRPGKK